MSTHYQKQNVEKFIRVTTLGGGGGGLIWISPNKKRDNW
jgi:hypothetical protein